MKTIEQHEDINLHITKKQLGISIYLIVSIFIWGYFLNVISSNESILGINLDISRLIFSIWMASIICVAIVMGLSE